MVHQGLTDWWKTDNASLQALENNDTMQSVPVPHARTWKGVRFRRPENDIRWLAPFNFFQIIVGGVVTRSLCACSVYYGNAPQNLFL